MCKLSIRMTTNCHPYLAYIVPATSKIVKANIDSNLTFDLVLVLGSISK